MAADIRNDRFDTWRAELGAFKRQSRKTDTQADGSPRHPRPLRPNSPCQCRFLRFPGGPFLEEALSPAQTRGSPTQSAHFPVPQNDQPLPFPPAPGRAVPLGLGETLTNTARDRAADGTQKLNQPTSGPYSARGVS